MEYYRLNYSELNRRWETGDETEPYALIYDNGAHPGGSFDVIKFWLADTDGSADVGFFGEARRRRDGRREGVAFVSTRRFARSSDAV